MSVTTKPQTRAEAESAGFTVARQKLIERYRHFELYSFDVSGNHEIGYRFEIRLTTPLWASGRHIDDIEPAEFVMNDEAQRVPVLARSVRVWMPQEKNLIGQPGAFAIMYQPGAIEQAKEQGRAAVDAIYRQFPLIQAREARLKAEREIVEARQRAKQLRRAQKLAAKYGAENLDEQWQRVLAG